MFKWKLRIFCWSTLKTFKWVKKLEYGANLIDLMFCDGDVWSKALYINEIQTYEHYGRKILFCKIIEKLAKEFGVRHDANYMYRCRITSPQEEQGFDLTLQKASNIRLVTTNWQHLIFLFNMSFVTFRIWKRWILVVFRRLWYPCNLLDSKF